ncbi:phosphoribosyl-AMP cyclohydrolase / phosphoribosyl-ATP pyrophosphohydrolase [Candidatus Blochmanniella floridana]|uniref:Histidine biosynthesis bifunctional protein HisIE n=1 Tax=Blochmanniella floridana TaxID=203907 RepID=HIS2_BLOFL|nr:RecName: Full=Histidine biosynthesis bifunctional protein HisIE; Includes: RecName: Full=Phosphoribosyl-AMP cyclohydrolase; Short=PRA-CH; Includes: RecName: Full=Phosphoribosyl-ATP pyrophosphatase; Short=PRA-PH [Candidatus Blochmannia floridanus]CAD83528.1 phosphoribosyl-AMP cyclohydrolase / phosphoribosyl-ATP pyrophosphohydrolase [Candidatus Blochmannia floridanus]
MLTTEKYQGLNWSKNHGLIPAIIQHSISGEVLMLGYMNQESMAITEKTGYVTFFSRSKNRLWIKGESSGNVLKLINWYPDCDFDSLLILVLPQGFTCHKNTNSCFHPALTDFSFLFQLENIISIKKNHTSSHGNQQSSYTSDLYTSGIERIAQKVGEEGLETALAAVSRNSKSLIDEASDLIYHLLVLLQHESLNFHDVIQELRVRSKLKKKH